MTTQCVQVKFEFGHSASIRKKPSPEGYTHDWVVFVTGSGGDDISHFVEKVVFILHESFHRPRRVVKDPPFRLEQSGYGGFTMPIEVYLRNREEPKKIQFMYDLYLQVEGEPMIEHCHPEKVTFRNPTEDFRRNLLLSGGVGVLDDGGIPPGAAYGIETLGAINSSSESRTPSKGKPGAVSTNVAQKKLKTTAAPTKDPHRHSSTSKHTKEPKTSSKDGKGRGKVPTKGASKRPPGSSSSEPQAKRKKEHSIKTPKTTSSEKSSSLGQDHSTKKTASSSSKKKKTAPKGESTKKEKKADLFVPEFTVEHKPKAPPVETAKKPTLPPFEDELSTGEVDEHPDSPSSKSTGSFSSLPRGGGAGGALETLMAEIDDNFEDEDDQDYNIPFKRDPPNSSSFQPVEDDSSSSSASFDEYLKQKQNKKEANAQPATKATERAVKKETKVEKKTKAEAKPKSTDSIKKSSAKVKDNDPKGSKVSENKKKTPPDKTKTKSKTYEKKEAKQQSESKTKSSETKTKPKTEKPKSETKKRSAEGKSKVSADGRTKAETKVKSVDGKSKESVREIERKGSIQTNNMDYLYELVDLHKRLMNLKDKDKLQRVVDLIGETGDFKITEKTFDFDLCSLDRPTVQKLKEYVPPL